MVTKTNNSKSEYCAYLRKSRADTEAEIRGEEETLARHKRILTDLADKMNIRISMFYQEVVSGETIADRPEVKKLLSDVENGLWKGVFVVEIERLARGNTKDQGIVAEAFKYSSTKIITPAKTYNPDDEFDEEYFEFGLFMSRREYKTINRRLQRGRIASVKEGKFISSTAPYGYAKVKIPHDKGYTLEIVPEEAEVVKNIFEWYCYGELATDGTHKRLGMILIAKKLDELGIKPVFNDVWSRASISDILQNITYTGKVAFGQKKEVRTSVNGNVVKKRKTTDEYVLAKGLHPAIISDELFELAKKARGINKTNTLPAKTALQNPLSGIVYCKKCGALMTRLGPNSRNKYATLKCPNRYCDNVSSPLFLIEEQILLFLRNWLQAYEVSNKYENDYKPQHEIIDKEKSLSKIKNDIAGLEKQLDKAYNLLEQGVYTIDVFKKRQAALNNEIKALNTSQSTIDEELAKLQAMKLEHEQFAPRVRHLLDTYSTNTVTMNNEILKEIMERILYSKDEPNRRGNLLNANFSLNFFPRIPL